jgi:hypothetical protein
MPDPSRSYEAISLDDLKRLGEIARIDREGFFARKPRYAVLRDRIIAVALAQGAALHYIDGKNGIKDFDVWSFYAMHPQVTFPQRRYIARDFGDSKFGQSLDRTDFLGRRVDLLGRSLDTEYPTDPVKALREYLAQGRTTSAVKLAEKAIVLIEPASLLGFVVWPP